MTSSRPYLIRAMYQWIVDNGMTPHILVDAANDSVLVPRQYEENGKVVLNIGPMAARTLKLGSDDVTFNARFSGTPMDVVVPIRHVLAIYTRENGQGMMFGDEDQSPPPESEGSESKKPRLRVVK